MSNVGTRIGCVIRFGIWPFNQRKRVHSPLGRRPTHTRAYLNAMEDSSISYHCQKPKFHCPILQCLALVLCVSRLSRPLFRRHAIVQVSHTCSRVYTRHSCIENCPRHRLLLFRCITDCISKIISDTFQVILLSFISKFSCE